MRYVHALWIATALALATAAQPELPDCGELNETTTREGLAVMGDGFTQAESGLFAAASRALLCEGALGQEKAFAPFVSRVGVRNIAVHSPSSTIARPGQVPQSALGIVYNGRRADCFFTLSADALRRIAGHAVMVLHTRTLVIVNIGDQVAGCADSAFTFITRGSNWKTTAHEIGHHLGLLDEYADRPGKHAGGVGPRANCSNTTSAWWLFLAQTHQGIDAIEGCDRHATGVYRGFAACRMRSEDDVFCPVCSTLIAEAFGTGPTTPLAAQARGAQERQPPPADVTSVQMIVELQRQVPGGDQVSVLGMAEVKGRPALRSRTRSPFLYAVYVGDRIVHAASLSADPFEQRAYGGTAAHLHTRQPTNRARLTLLVPGTGLAALRESRFGLRVMTLTGAADARPPVLDAQIVGGLGAGAVTTIFRSDNVQLPAAR
jgi:hypothetical protein